MTDQGRLKVTKGGRRIVFSQQGGRLVLDQVKGKPGLYRGTIKEKSLGAPLKYELRVINPERFEGIMTANFRAQGTKCTLSRDFKATYVGK